MDFALNEEQRLIQKTAKDFAQRSVAPRAGEIDETQEFPHDLVKGMGELGFMGMNVPDEYDGAGYSELDLASLLLTKQTATDRTELDAANGTFGATVAAGTRSITALLFYVYVDGTTANDYPLSYDDTPAQFPLQGDGGWPEGVGGVSYPGGRRRLRLAGLRGGGHAVAGADDAGGEDARGVYGAGRADYG